MADLPYIQEAQEIKITGQDATGNTVNYVGADANGNLLVKDYSDGPVTPGTVASASSLAGGQYNSTSPTLTTGQQSAIQLDASGNLKITGTVTASNPSVSTVNTTPPGSATYIGGSVTTGLPTYTTGQMSPLSLTTSGLLRTAAFTYDGVGNAITSSSNGNATNQQLLNVLVPNTTVVPVALNALNATVSIAMAGLAGCGFQMAAGTFIGTITPQCSIDGGTTWTNVTFLEPATETVVSTYSFASANPATVLTVLPAGGTINIRVVVTSYSSGTANAILSASEISISTGSTASVATDLSGNGNITAINQTVTAVLHGCAAMVWDIQGTFVATIQFQATVNGGIDWFDIQGIYAPYNTVSGIWSANAQIIVSCGGYQQVRVICTSYTSGTMTLYWDASAGSNFTWSYVYNEQPVNLQTLDNAYMTSSSYPSPYNVTSYTPQALNQDAYGNLQIRGPAISDEGSLRDDFTGTSLLSNLTGTAFFNNGSTSVNGSGTSYTTQVGVGQYIRLNADPEADFAQVSSVNNDTSLALDLPYNGTTTGAAAVASNWATTTGSGSLTVASSILSISSGTTSGNTTAITRDIDYLPLSVTTYASISQRIANQAAILGFVDDSNNNAAVVQFTGTINTQINFITAFSSQASDIQTTLVTLPNGATTATMNVYVIDLGASQATLSINGIIVAENTLHLPGPYSDLQARFAITNSATVTATTLAIDNVYFENIDRLQIASDYSGEPMAVGGGSNSGQPDNNAPPVKIGAVYNSTTPTYTTGQRTDLQTDASGNLKITGTVTASNPSVGSTAATPPTSATYAGASVTTASPTYVTGQMDPLSLNTSGGLRISGVTGIIDALSTQNILTPASGILTLGEFNTTPTTITSGNSSPLQLDNTANLLVNLKTAIPAGSNSIGTVQPGNTANTTPWLVTVATALPAGANIIGALTANQSVNLAQVAGSTTAVSATGVQKVGIVGNAGAIVDQAPGSAIPANAIQVGGTDGTNTRVLPVQAKNTQSTYAVSVQNQHDTGRNITNYWMVLPIVTTATDALMSLTGYKSGAAVTATTTPAVVTTGKTYRITAMTLTYVAITTAGYAQFTLRANTSGVVAIGSPAVVNYHIGATAATAGVVQQISVPVPEGIEFAAGTGIGISMIGYGATGTAAAVGYGSISIQGYEY